MEYVYMYMHTQYIYIYIYVCIYEYMCIIITLGVKLKPCDNLLSRPSGLTKGITSRDWSQQ